MPQKEKVYFFPENLSVIGECIRDCKEINDVLVFGDKITSHTSTMFTNTGVSGETKSVVFLGKMTSFTHTETIGHTINFYFPNTTSADISVTTGNRNYNNTAIYLCSIGKKCTFGWSTVTWSDYTQHLENPKLAEIVEATCYSNKSAVTKCFCGTVLTSGEVENSMLVVLGK